MEHLSILASDLDNLQYTRKWGLEVHPNESNSVQALSAIRLNSAQVDQLLDMVEGTHVRVTVVSDGSKAIAFYTDYPEEGHRILWEDGIPSANTYSN